MIKSYVYSDDGVIRQNVPLHEYRLSLDNPDCRIWVNLEDPSEDEISTVLHDIFNFHPLTIEDCLSDGYQPPKVDDFGDYLFIIAHAIIHRNHDTTLDTSELNLFLGKNYLVTCYMDARMPPVDKVSERIFKDERIFKEGLDAVCHAILDALVDDYLPVLDQLNSDLDILEDQVLSDPNSSVLPRLLDLKHDIMYMRRIVAPERDVINRLSRDAHPHITPEMMIYFRDIFDHLVHIQDLTESTRDILTGVLDIYLNSTSLKLNSIMKALTIVSTIFLPLSFVAGVYGMNFRLMPELNWVFGYPLAWTIFISISGGMVYFFKKKNWF